MNKLSHRFGRLLSTCIAGALVASVIGAVGARAADLDMPVPTSVIYPGQSVLDRGVVDKRFKVAADRLSAYVIENEMLKDRVARRTLLPNRPILLSDLKAPDAVKVGVATRLFYQESGLLITAMGMPLQSASVGDVVRVRNIDSGVTVNGTAMDDGSIQVSAQ